MNSHKGMPANHRMSHKQMPGRHGHKGPIKHLSPAFKSMSKDHGAYGMPGMGDDSAPQGVGDSAAEAQELAGAMGGATEAPMQGATTPAGSNAPGETEGM